MKKLCKISIFVLCIACLAISMILLYNVGIFVDEYNLSPSIIFGSTFGQAMYWIKLAFLGVLCILSGINLFVKDK